MKFRLELRDKQFNVIDILDNEYMNLNWSYSRIGGCGSFSFDLPRKIFEDKVITGEQNIRIYKRDDLNQTYDLWYQGLVGNKTPSVIGDTENINITGHGYQKQLERIYVSDGSVARTYVSTEVSAIVTDVLDNFIVGNTDITYDAGDIENTGFTPSLIELSNDAKTVMENLSSLVGTREWGVDKNRKFFFKTRSTAIGNHFVLGKNITNYSEEQDFNNIINRVFIQGAQSGGTYFFSGPYEDVPSQLKYNIRSEVRQNSSISSSSDAEQMANALLEEYKLALTKAKFNLVDFNAQVEATNPIDLITVLTKGVRYGQKRYGTFYYSGRVYRTINRVNYSLSDNNALTITVDAGQPRPSLSERIAQLEFELEQQRSAAL